MKQMKKYIAIGHWGKEKDATYSVATANYTMKAAKRDYVGNDFVAYCVISEEKLNQIKEMNWEERFETVRKMTSNYRKWDIVLDYLDQCMDIMEERLAAVE